MEEEVSRALRGRPDEVLSEGFGLSLTRKDLQTLSNLNWLNDEVSRNSAGPRGLLVGFWFRFRAWTPAALA